MRCERAAVAGERASCARTFLPALMQRASDPARSQRNYECRARGRPQRCRSIVSIVAKLAHGGADDAAAAELKRHLRDTVAFERGTVWRDMVGLERGRNNAHVTRPARAPAARRSAVLVAAGVVAFIALLNIELLPHAMQQRALAMVTFLAWLWGTEAIPLYVTSMVVPLLTVILRIVPSSKGNFDDPLSAPDTAKHVFSVRVSAARLRRCLVCCCRASPLAVGRVRLQRLQRNAPAPARRSCSRPSSCCCSADSRSRAR